MVGVEPCNKFIRNRSHNIGERTVMSPVYYAFFCERDTL